MRITALATKTGISIREDGAEVKFIEDDLRVSRKGYRGIDTDVAEMALEDIGLGVRTWIWNGKKGHYITLLVRL